MAGRRDEQFLTAAEAAEASFSFFAFSACLPFPLPLSPALLPPPPPALLPLLPGEEEMTEIEEGAGAGLPPELPLPPPLPPPFEFTASSWPGALSELPPSSARATRRRSSSSASSSSEEELVAFSNSVSISPTFSWSVLVRH